MISNTDTDIETSFRVIKKANNWYIWIDGTTLHATGASLEQAYQLLQEQETALKEFEIASGYQPIPVLDRNKVQKWKKEFLSVARTVLVVGLCAIPLSYMISTGISRGWDNMQVPTKRAILNAIEKTLYQFADGKLAMTPEREKQIISALGKSIKRLQKYSVILDSTPTCSNGRCSETSNTVLEK